MPAYRQARGRQHPLLALLLLVSVATLCGARSQSAIADWGRDHGQPWLRRLGFTRDRAPSQPTRSRLFGRIAYKVVEAAVQRWAEQARRLCAPPSGAALEGVARDGKTLRGSTRQGAADAHLLAAFSHRLGGVLGQVGVPDKTNAIGAADELLRSLVLAGRVVPADALLTQRAVAQAVRAGGGDDLLVVKATQPTLHADIAAAFAPAADTVGVVGAACTVTQHGGLTATTALVGYSDWPGLPQARCLERRVLDKRTGGLLRQETAYAVTSLPHGGRAPRGG